MEKYSVRRKYGRKREPRMSELPVPFTTQPCSLLIKVVKILHSWRLFTCLSFSNAPCSWYRLNWYLRTIFSGYTISTRDYEEKKDGCFYIHMMYRIIYYKETFHVRRWGKLRNNGPFKCLSRIYRSQIDSVILKGKTVNPRHLVYSFCL